MTVKELFAKAENGVFTLEQFESAAKDAHANFTDLSEGKYVSKSKYEDDLKAKDTQIETLNTTISDRDTDLVKLREQLEKAGNDTTALAELNTKLQNLQTQYDTDAKNYQAQLSQQAYEFAVKEYANSQKFTSNAAKRDFIQSMIGEKLKMKNNEILGASDFQKTYAEANSDAFVVETPPEPPKNSTPSFILPTPGPEPTPGDGGFKFNFTGVRPNPNESK